MIEKGEVIGTEGKLAFVKFVRTSACGNCTACGMASGEKQLIIDVLNTKGARKGDLVEIEIETKKALFSSMIAYIFPLVMLIVGVAAGYWLSGRGIIKADREIVSAAFGIGLTILSFTAIRLLEPVFKKKLVSTYRIVDKKV